MSAVANNHAKSVFMLARRNGRFLTILLYLEGAFLPNTLHHSLRSMALFSFFSGYLSWLIFDPPKSPLSFLSAAGAAQRLMSRASRIRDGKGGLRDTFASELSSLLSTIASKSLDSILGVFVLPSANASAAAAKIAHVLAKPPANVAGCEKSTESYYRSLSDQLIQCLEWCKEPNDAKSDSGAIMAAAVSVRLPKHSER